METETKADGMKVNQEEAEWNAPSRNEEKIEGGDLDNPENQGFTSTDIEDMLDRVPPDFDLAKRHGEASKIKNFYDPHDVKGTEEGLVCECCGMPTFKMVPKYGMCSNTSKLDALGSGFPLFYSFKKYTLYMFIVMFILVGIYTLIISVSKSDAKYWIDDNEDPPLIVRSSLGALGILPEDHDTTVVSLLHWIFIPIVTVVVLISTIILRKL